MQIQVVGEMQQKVFPRRPCLFTENGQECGAPADPQHSFRCSRCWEHERFRSLSSLSAHLEYSHNYYHTMHELRIPTSRGRSQLERVLQMRSLSNTRDVTSCMERCRRHSVGTQVTEKMQTGDEEEGASEDDIKFCKSSPVKTNIPSPPPLDNPTEPGSKTEEVSQKWSVCAEEGSVRHRLTNVLRAAESTMQRKLHRISRELAQTDTELQTERAHSQHLAQERQEVHERERALSRQVDMTVMVIATLKKQLNNSESELERREQEVVTIQNFLEAAAQHEICGKVRIQHFIENLLKRIALAERLLEYYQISPSPPNYNDYMTDENGPNRITKSRSAGLQLSQSCPHEEMKSGHSAKDQLGLKTRC
ncbi:hypothetical protein DPEC_G00034740 [Dallia pectoralis]|uniref:Uncharacterized protein n=1 Tax=Dallia pectoralis TaxID=75939 RepID=A0ACC2HDX4_DALPE|nr:hypothetical protein DPEC_G00034740 [Dallia pectoralis]